MTIRLVAGLLCLALPVIVDAGSRITYRNVDGGGSQTVLVGANRIRIDADSDNRIIIDPAKGTVIVLHLADREYLRIDRAALRRWVAQANDTLGRVDDMLANVPAELRGGVQDLIGTGTTASRQSLKVIDGGSRGTAAGHACTNWQVSRNGERIGSACVGDAGVWELSAADLTTVQSAIRLLQDWSGELRQGELARHVELSTLRANQLPLRISHDDNGRERSLQFSGSDSMTVEASDFAIPAGFREKALELPGF